MTFTDKLAELRGKATKGALEVSHDYRPGMSWNNHIVVADSPFTICFMAHEPKGNEGQEAIAELFVMLANNAEAIEKVVRSAEKLYASISKDCYCDNCLELRAALAELEEG